MRLVGKGRHVVRRIRARSRRNLLVGCEQRIALREHLVDLVHGLGGSACLVIDRDRHSHRVALRVVVVAALAILHFCNGVLVRARLAVGDLAEVDVTRGAVGNRNRPILGACRHGSAVFCRQGKREAGDVARSAVERLATLHRQTRASRDRLVVVGERITVELGVDGNLVRDNLAVDVAP